MKKINQSIRDLARALYETRPTPGAEFDPEFALSELAHAGANGGVTLLGAQCQLNGFDLAFDKERLGQLLSANASARAETLYLLYCTAILQHEPFTDVLGLANDLMWKRYGVRLPDFFLNTQGRVYCQHFAQTSIAHGLPLLTDDHNRSGSGLLASMSGLVREPELLGQRKVRMLMFCRSSLAAKMLLMQLFTPLCNFMQFVEWVKIAEGTSTNAKHLLTVQRQHHNQEAA